MKYNINIFSIYVLLINYSKSVFLIKILEGDLHSNLSLKSHYFKIPSKFSAENFSVIKSTQNDSFQSIACKTYQKHLNLKVLRTIVKHFTASLWITRKVAMLTVILHRCPYTFSAAILYWSTTIMLSLPFFSFWNLLKQGVKLWEYIYSACLAPNSSYLGVGRETRLDIWFYRNNPLFLEWPQFYVPFRSLMFS